MSGPPPKRSDQRIRRNKDEVPIDKIEAIGTVEVPELGIADPHPLVAEFYESLKDSAQQKYYEPTDWWTARWIAYTLDKYLKAGKPSAMLFQNINSALTGLMMTEADRRRLRLEIERQGDSKGADVIDIATMFENRFAQ